MKIRTVIADDEELARRGLRALSQRCEDVEILASAEMGMKLSRQFTATGRTWCSWMFRCRGRRGSM